MSPTSRIGSRWVGLLGLLSLFIPSIAHAHSAAQGVGDFTVGAMHPWVTPAHVLILLGLAIQLGQRAPVRLGPPVIVFTVALAGALGLTMLQLLPEPPVAVLSVGGLLIGVIVAAHWEPPVVLKCVLFGLLAVGVGLDSGLQTGSTVAIAKTLAGTWVSLVVCLISGAYYASLATASKRKWIEIALRILGSWIAAISMLMIAFALRKQS